MPFDIVVAVDSEGGIGKNNSIPWRLSDDLKRFRQLTSLAAPGKINAVIMGRKTWESLPAKSRPLPNRLNIVLSRASVALPEGVLSAHSLDQALSLAQSEEVDRCFVLGGGQIYKEAMQHIELGKIYLTRIHRSFDCDVFFPELRDLETVHTSECKQENGMAFEYVELRKKVTCDSVGGR